MLAVDSVRPRSTTVDFESQTHQLRESWMKSRWWSQRLISVPCSNWMSWWRHVCYSESEVRKLSEIFCRMLNDPSAKVMTLFLETLPMFVTSHADDVPSDWIYVVLSRLFARVSAEQFSSVLSRLRKVLIAIRWLSHPSLFYSFVHFSTLPKVFWWQLRGHISFSVLVVSAHLFCDCNHFNRNKTLKFLFVCLECGTSC